MHRGFPARATAFAFAAVLATVTHAFAQSVAPATSAADSIAVVDESTLAVRPQMVNRPQVAQALTQRFTRLGSEGSGRAVLTFVVDEEGRMTSVEIDNSSGSTAVDRAMIDVAKRMRWSPSTVDGRPVRVRMHLPMAYRVAGGGSAAVSDDEKRRRGGACDALHPVLFIR